MQPQFQLMKAPHQFKYQENQKPDSGNFFTSLIPTGGGIAGTAAGAGIGTAIAPGIGTLIGALLGGAVGGGGGKVAENAIEGKDLTQGVGQEALINGVLGAGPLRLGKAAIDVGRGLKAGTGLADAVANAGTNAVQGSIKGAIGNKLTDASNNMVVKNFKLTPSQLNNFQSKFGEDASQTIKKYGLVGKDASTITEGTIKPLQNEFGNITQQIPSIPTADVLKAFKAKYEPLTNSAVEDNQAIGNQLKQQADTLAKKYGAEVPSTELNKIRQEFDGLASYTNKAANPARYGVNKRSADAIRSVLQTTADKAGIKASNGMTFKQVGQELSKLHQLTDNIGKQEQLGRGSNPLGLSTLLGGIGGSGVGGLPGGIGGAVLTKAVNSGAGRQALASTTEKVGARLTNKAAAANPFGAKSIAGRIAPTGLLGSVGQASLNNASNSMQSPTNIIPAMSPNNMDTSYNTSQDMSSSQSPYSKENLMADIQRDPKNADKYLSYYSALDKVFSPASQKLNSTQMQQADNARSGLESLGTIQQTLSQNPSAAALSSLPGGSLTQSLTGTGSYAAALANATDVIGRLRSGGAINADEEKRFKAMLPSAFDSKETVDYKLSAMASLFNRFANPQSAQPDTSNNNDLLSALMGAQG